jgi:pimeloyl-ACP methyl ester carboxylesterase
MAVHAEDVVMTTLQPSLTDSAISSFDVPHRLYLKKGVEPRRELLLWLPGTMPTPDVKTAQANRGEGVEGPAAFCRLAAERGYHVLSLRYPNSMPASFARGDDAVEFERFRRAIIYGGTSKHITVARADSIENRLIKALQYLAAKRPSEGWAQFLKDDKTVYWERIAVAGQSQGGGHAALIALHHRVARVICTGAPKDYNLKLKAPAAWMRAESATPKSRFFTFNHLQDRQAATWAQQLENLRALGLDAFGEPVSVDTEKPPFQRSRILFTDFPGKKVSSKEAHLSVITWRNARVFGPVWEYMLTEPVE